VIDAIKNDAAGAACETQFGSGTDTLNIGVDRIVFDNGTDGNEWGEITLTGKLISSYNGEEYPAAIYLSGINIFVNNKANIYSVLNIGQGYKISSSGGTLKIIEGEVNWIDVQSSGTLNIMGGTVLGCGLSYTTTGAKINISGGTVKGYIGTWGTGTITISDNALIISEDGHAIDLRSRGSLVMTGGTVIAKNGYAVYSNGNTYSYDGPRISFDGGLLFAVSNNGNSGVAAWNNYFNEPIYGNNAVITANVNKDSEVTAMSGNYISSLPAYYSAWWDRSNGGGIAYDFDYASRQYTGFIPLDVTIIKADPFDYYYNDGLRVDWEYIHSEQEQYMKQYMEGMFYGNEALDGMYNHWNDFLSKYNHLFEPWDPTILTELTAEYGKPLSSVSLPKGWVGKR
ncbi:MAG: hypothetical protein LBB56_05755, partial [Chitinispirillales bacterium]|nr:hypothetical protein [Chitinispirillales bacterium]